MKILFVTIIAAILSACASNPPQKPQVKVAPANPVYYTTVEIPKY